MSREERVLRGQASIESLVILIAALIVAAATAGVIVHTTGVLQSKSSVTSGDVSAEITTSLDVVSVTGRIDSNGSTPVVDSLRVIIARDGGDSPIDLGEALVRVHSDTGVESLTYNASMSTRGNSFTVVAYRDDDGSAPVLTEAADRFALVANTSALQPTETVRVDLVLRTGATKTVRVRVPRDLEGQSAITLR
ncbi:MAG: archaellin/type IV pilin N-terminal domain-containing protein [Haloferacaceae archaeon]